MTRNLIYLINPISGTKGKDALVNQISLKTKQQNIQFNILHTNAEGDYRYLIQKIETEKITDIIVCGGDGTVNQVAGALLGVAVNIGIIPMGSGNGLALAAKIPRNIDHALELIFYGKACFIDSFYINNQFSCMLCGLGFDAQVAHDFAKQSKRGLASYIKHTFLNFITAKPHLFKIINKSIPFNVDAFFISIANSNQFGNSFTIAPQASLQDGLLDIVVVKKMNKIRLFWLLVKQMINGKIQEHDEKTFHEKDILYFQTHELEIENPALAPLHIDGEAVETAAKFNIRLIPNAFKLIQ
jgi:YegS/Rv2252/BmrU family lipid kinase